THTITYKIDRPPFVRSGCWRPLRRSRPANPPSLPNAHAQSLLAIQPIDPLVIGRASGLRQHCRQTPIAEAHSLRRQFFQSLTQIAVSLRSLRPIAMGRSCQLHQPAGVPFAHLVLLHGVTRGCPKSRRLYQFFARTSLSARLSSVSSATTCFSFRFSSSSCLSLLASPLSIPPYFAFQRYKVCSTMPCCRHSSDVAIPDSPCFKIAMICSSLCRVPFTALLLSSVGRNSHSTWHCFWGLRQKQPNRQKNLRGTLSRSWTGTGLLGKLQKPIHGSGCFPARHWEKPALREHEWPFHRRI